MKERPILFSAPMVRAILDGRKIQTRRVVKPQPTDPYTGTPLTTHHAASLMAGSCRFGETGDRLWVRETWVEVGDDSNLDDGDTEARPDGAGWVRHIAYRATVGELDLEEDGGGWSSSIYMPRWASRITLEVTGVRVERLQDITTADAMAEGAAHRIAPGGDLAGAFDHCDMPINYRNHFRDLWESINGAGSWAANPWVWVIEFRRVTP